MHSANSQVNQNKKELPKDLVTFLDLFSQKESERSRKVASLSKAIKDFLQMDSTDELKQREMIDNLRSFVFKIFEKDHEIEQIYVRDISFKDVIYRILYFLAEVYSVNSTDPISLEPIPEEEKITLLTGQQFSLVNLLNYNKERYYRGSQLGESVDSKFLINPLTNQPFSSTETNMILAAAAKSNFDLSFLVDKMIANTNTGLLGFFTLKQTAAIISALANGKSSYDSSNNNLSTEGNDIPVCKIERDEWNKEGNNLENNKRFGRRKYFYSRT